MDKYSSFTIIRSPFKLAVKLIACFVCSAVQACAGQAHDSGPTSCSSAVPQRHRATHCQQVSNAAASQKEQQNAIFPPSPGFNKSLTLLMWLNGPYVAVPFLRKGRILGTNG